MIAMKRGAEFVAKSPEKWRLLWLGEFRFTMNERRSAEEIFLPLPLEGDTAVV